MRREKKLQILLGTVVLVPALGLPAMAETLSGMVVDPQQRVIVDAKVSLTCADRSDNQSTDGGGNFIFIRQVFPEDCTIRAEYPGFGASEVRVGRKRTFALQLRLAEVKQTVTVKAAPLSPAAIDSASVSDADLRNISNNTNDLVAYAKRLAGVQSGSDQIYVDGLPSDHLPTADRIESITVNADPFSAEYSDGGNTHIDIVT